MGAAAPIIMVAATVAGTAYSVMQSRKAGEAQRKMASLEAAQSREEAGQLAKDTKEKHKRIMATQRAMYGASGLEMEGSPLQVMQESLIQSKEQIRRIYEAGENQSLAQLYSGKQMEQAAKAKGIKQILSSGSEVVQTGSNYNWW